MHQPRQTGRHQTTPRRSGFACIAGPGETRAAAGNVRRQAAAACGVLWCALLAACAGAPEVRTLATGRTDITAYALDGRDLDSLRAEVARLCPLGGEVLRQSVQGQPAAPSADGRWHRAWQAAGQWIDPPQQSAQLVVACREPGERTRIAPATADRPLDVGGAASALAGGGTGANRSASPATGGSVTTSARGAAGLPQAALPVGPVVPTW